MITCQKCGNIVSPYRNPALTVDIIIETLVKAPESEYPQIVLIERKNEPLGFALPGGFVDYGESVEAAALREALEETNLQIEIRYLLGVYSAPDRDPRQHTVSVVFVATTVGTPQAGDDAKSVHLADPKRLSGSMVFDHEQIIDDYITSRNIGR